MKISIITVTYNSAATLERTIVSLEQQTYKDIEYIVIDGASKDGTLDILQRHKSFISKMVSEPDQGIYDAINKGVHMATGEVIGILNSDDVLADKTTLETVVQKLEGGADVLYGDLLYCRVHGEKETIVRYWRSHIFSPKYLRRGWMPPHPTLYVHRAIYDRVGDYDTQFRIAADYDFILRTFSLPELKTVYLPNVMVKMTTGGVSNRDLKSIWQKTKEDYRALKKNNIGGWFTVILKNVSKINQFFQGA